MAVTMARTPIIPHRRREFDFPVGPSFSEMVFGFLDNGEGLLESVNPDNVLDEEDDEKEISGLTYQNRNFWEKQHQLLQATLCRTSSLESRIRNATKEALKEIKMVGSVCVCGKTTAAASDGGCRNCLMREVSCRLQKGNFNSAICKTKWRSSQDIPSGDHTFLDVVENSSTKGKVRVIIELNFRTEFEMARASEEYNRLVRRLPEVFVGKLERIESVTKILCTAAKKCMKEKKMHMGPWRKLGYMQAKWLSTCERTTLTSVFSINYSGKLTKPKGSMLTVDLKYMHPTAVM